MLVDLTGLPLTKMSPAPVRLGGVVSSPLGGSQRINRLGDKWSFDCASPLMDVEPHGRLWSAGIDRAVRDGAVMAIHQPGFSTGAPGAPKVAVAASAGLVVSLKGLTPGYSLRIGQWMTITHGGQRYADRIDAPAIVAADGTATVTMRNLLRTPIEVNDVVELAVAFVEGDVFDFTSWDVDLEEIGNFAFRIVERD